MGYHFSSLLLSWVYLIMVVVVKGIWLSCSLYQERMIEARIDQGSHSTTASLTAEAYYSFALAKE